MAHTSDTAQNSSPQQGERGLAHHGHGHSHSHGSSLATNTAEGLRAVVIATIGMCIVAAVEFAFFGVSHSAGLLSDALHNLGDVLTTVALWAAFLLVRRPATTRFTYGFHRAEDLAGAFIALVITASAGAAAYESYRRLIAHAQPSQVGWGIAAALFGFVGNEVLAQYKMRVGSRINSQPLIADGQHSRADGLTSLAAAVGLVLTLFGVPEADPIAGLLISIAILYILIDVGRDVLNRLMDAVDPAVVTQVRELAQAVPGVREVADVRARWAGRRLYIAFNIGADAALTLAQAHTIAETARQEVLAHVAGAAIVDIHVDPLGLPEDPHRWKHPSEDDDDHDHDNHDSVPDDDQRHSHHHSHSYEKTDAS